MHTVKENEEKASLITQRQSRLILGYFPSSLACLFVYKENGDEII